MKCNKCFGEIKNLRAFKSIYYCEQCKIEVLDLNCSDNVLFEETGKNREFKNKKVRK